MQSTSGVCRVYARVYVAYVHSSLTHICSLTLSRVDAIVSLC